jgi:microcystin-dependent protein
MSEPFIGEIRMFGFNFPPRGWALCNGQNLSIAQNTALFSLLGTTYGGNGTTTFALPDLRGRVPIHFGQGPGLSNYTQGEMAGAETNTLLVGNMPAHSHALNARGGTGDQAGPAGALFARDAAGQSAVYSSQSPDGTTMHAQTIGASGGSQPFGIRQPYLVVNFSIALEGIFPPRD